MLGIFSEEIIPVENSVIIKSDGSILTEGLTEELLNTIQFSKTNNDYCLDIISQGEINKLATHIFGETINGDVIIKAVKGDIVNKLLWSGYLTEEPIEYSSIDTEVSEVKGKEFKRDFIYYVDATTRIGNTYEVDDLLFGMKYLTLYGTTLERNLFNNLKIDSYGVIKENKIDIRERCKFVSGDLVFVKTDSSSTFNRLASYIYGRRLYGEFVLLNKDGSGVNSYDLISYIIKMNFDTKCDTGYYVPVSYKRLSQVNIIKKKESENSVSLCLPEVKFIFTVEDSIIRGKAIRRKLTSDLDINKHLELYMIAEDVLNN